MAENKTQEEQLLMWKERWKEYDKLHSFFLPGVTPGYFSAELHHRDNPNFVHITNTITKSIVSGIYGGTDDPETATPYLQYVRAKFGEIRTAIEAAGRLVDGCKAFVVSKFSDYFGDSAEYQGLYGITMRPRPGMMREYRTSYGLWPAWMIENPQIFQQVSSCCVIDILSRHISSIKNPTGCQICWMTPAIETDNGKNLTFQEPMDFSFNKAPKVTWKLSMVDMIRGQRESDAWNRWDEDNNPFPDLKAVTLVPADASHMPKDLALLLSETYDYFDKEYGESFGVKTVPESEEQRLIQARTHLYLTFMHPKVVNTFFFLKNQPIGLMQYHTVAGGPIHLNSLYVYKEFRGKGYGSWMLKNFLRETYAIAGSIPRQTLRIFGASIDKLIPFYKRAGFVPAQVEYSAIFKPAHVREMKQIIDN